MRGPGKRYQLHEREIIAAGGLIENLPYILSQAQTFRAIEHRHDDITQIFVAMRGGDANGVDVSEEVKQTLSGWIPSYLHVNEVKEAGAKAAQLADDIFSRIFALFALFALAVGLLFIFLIFVLLAAERRAAMGMARAIGVERRDPGLVVPLQGTGHYPVSS